MNEIDLTGFPGGFNDLTNNFLKSAQRVAIIYGIETKIKNKLTNMTESTKEALNYMLSSKANKPNLSDEKLMILKEASKTHDLIRQSLAEGA